MLRKTIPVSLTLIVIMFSSLFIGTAALNPQVGIRAVGTVNYGSPTDVTVYVNFGNQTMTNAFRLGTQINEWRWSLITANQELRDACKELNLGFMREYTIGRFQPCKSWDSSTNSGTYDWTDFDALIEFMLWCGAEPIITIESADISGMTGAGVNKLPDPHQFGIHCQNVIRHCNEKGYGIKYYDLVNEPYFYYTPQELCDWFNIVQGYCYAEDSSILLSQSACHVPRFFDYYVDHIQGMKWFAHHGYTSWSGNGRETDEAILRKAETLEYMGAGDRMRTPKEMREMWYAKHGEWLDAICIETNMDAYYSEATGTDPRMQQIFGAVFWAEASRTRILQGARGASWYEYCSYDLRLKGWPEGHGLGMINMYSPFERWYPYYVNYLYGNNLAEGDPIYESTSSNFEALSSLAWKHGNNYKILLVSKTTSHTTVSINGFTANNVTMQLIESTTDPDEIVGSIKTQTISPTSPIQLSFNGYCVALLTVFI